MKYGKLSPDSQRVALQVITQKIKPIVDRVNEASKQMETSPHDSMDYIDGYYEMMGAKNEIELLVGRKMTTCIMQGNHIGECMYLCSASFSMGGELENS